MLGQCRLLKFQGKSTEVRRENSLGISISLPPLLPYWLVRFPGDTFAPFCPTYCTYLGTYFKLLCSSCCWAVMGVSWIVQSGTAVSAAFWECQCSATHHWWRLSANIALLDRVSRQLLQIQPVYTKSGRWTALRGILQQSYSTMVRQVCLELDSFA